MPIEIRCPQCRRRFRVPEKYAGKRIRCPQCQGTIAVPAAEGPTAGADQTVAKRPTVAPRAPRKPAPTRWFLQTEEGEQYGPISREELDTWVAEGRVDASCQVLQEGWEQWKWAEEVFAQLARPSVQPTPVEDNPFAGIAEAVEAKQQVNPFVSPQAAGGPAVSVDTEAGDAVTPGMRQALAQTRPWVVFLAILGFIVGGLGVLVGLVAALLHIATFGPIGLLVALVVLVGPALYLVASYYLLNYGQRIRTFLRSNRNRELEAALFAQKSFWKLVGIVTLVVLILYLLMILAVIALGGMLAAWAGSA